MHHSWYVARIIPARALTGQLELSNDLKVTQALPSEQRISGPQHEGPPQSPGNRYSGALGGNQGKRLSAEHAVGVQTRDGA